MHLFNLGNGWYDPQSVQIGATNAEKCEWKCRMASTLINLQNQLAQFFDRMSLRGADAAQFLFLEQQCRTIEASLHENKWWIEAWDLSENESADSLAEWLVESDNEAQTIILEWLLNSRHT